jgi:hypothetical protein
MSHQFSQVPQADIPRSNFNRSHGYKTTFDSGYLVPFYVDEALPGDTFNLSATIFARLATPIVPLMDNLFLDTFYFAVPIRLIWENWQRFNGEQDDPGDSTDYLVPIVAAGAGDKFDVGALEDYFGIPTGIENIKVSALWHRAYNLIWNEWFRDQNLQQSRPVNKDDGPDSRGDYRLLRRGKRHDYFTSCLPWPQKGPGVELPIGGQAAVYGNGKTLGLTDGTIDRGIASIFYSIPPSDPNNLYWLSSFHSVGTRNAFYNQNLPYSTNDYTDVSQVFSNQQPSVGFGVVGPGKESGLYADLSTATAVTINSFRQAFQVQRLLERDARGGTRYTEIIRSHFGVVSPDARLQRPEYLGGSSSRIIIHPVEQTSATDSTSPQGNLSAFGLCAASGHGFVKSFTEHCVLIGLVNVRADLTYQQGVPRMFSRRTRWDFYWPALAHLGEQAVLNKEIYAQGPAILNAQGNPVDDDVFGYQERWAEYRYFPSQITGKFRSTFAQPLDVWHLSQKFTTLPVLNEEFIEDNPPIKRVIAVPSEPQILMDSYISLQCARPMPVYSVPGLIDHF